MRDVSDGGHRGQRPGEALIAGGFGPRGAARPGGYSGQQSRRHSKVRVAAPLAVPVALGITLGIILAVSSGPAHTHVTQGNSGTTSSSSAPASSGAP
jgi:hypothetical protein